jgi:ubiquitin-conjugating enzyme E2 variant
MEVTSREELAHYGPGQRAKDILAVFAFLALAAYATYLVVLRFDGVTTVSLFIGATVLGLLAADFISGFVHWLGDTWGSIDMPVLGPAFIRPFREHHVDEKAITRHDFFETNGNNCFVSLPALAAILFLPLDSHAGLFAAAFLISMTLWVFLTNQVHKWSHMDEPPAWIALLQRYHLVLNPAHHQIHHTRPYSTYYCITNGWLNPLLHKIAFFPTLERTVTKLTGIHPRREDAVTVELV